MTSGEGEPPELHEVVPREQSGAGTGDRFEFQYHQAAADALHVLDDTQVACVYCEWHDDYVVEPAGVVSYRFHQVKTRSASQGPWTLNQFFGVQGRRGKKPQSVAAKPRTATSDSIFGRLFDHVSRFGERCECFVFVSDAGIASDFRALVEAARVASDHSELSGSAADEFSSLLAALGTAFASLTADGLFAFLKRFHPQDAIGKVGDLKACRTLIGGRIYEMSEVNLTMSEAQKIADVPSVVETRKRRLPPQSWRLGLRSQGDRHDEENQKGREKRSAQSG